MKQIHRYDIVFNAFREPVCLSLRRGFDILTFYVRGGVPSLYVKEDAKEKSDDRFIRLLTTNDEVPDDYQYLGTFALSEHEKSLIIHAFFVPRPAGTAPIAAPRT